MDDFILRGSIKNILRCIEGKDCERPGLKDTPDRVVRAYKELFGGYDVDIDKLFTTFEGEGADQLVAIKDISYNSFCEHHLLPFSGIAHVAYLPNSKAIGASKIPRLVEAYSQRLQIQERLTEQIGNKLMERLKPKGVAVILEGQHYCMICRGVKSQTSKMITSVMLGEFRENVMLRAEVLSLLGLNRG